MSSNQSIIVSITSIKNVTPKQANVHVEAYDPIQGKTFKGTVKMNNGMPQGDFIKPGRTPLSLPCLHAVRAKVINDYANR